MLGGGCTVNRLNEWNEQVQKDGVENHERPASVAKLAIKGRPPASSGYITVLPSGEVIEDVSNQPAIPKAIRRARNGVL